MSGEITHSRRCPECGEQTYSWERCHHCGDVPWKEANDA